MSDKRQIVLDAALALFRAYGYRAVGIDRIIAESGVAKMTMYKYFPSKNALIEAVLSEHDQCLRQSMMAGSDAFADPKDRLRALFLWHHRWFHEPSFNGCMFINAVAEFPEPGNSIRQVSIGHKARIESSMAAILAPLLGADAARLAAQMSQLLDGATIGAQMAGADTAAFLAWRSAVGLLRQEGVPIEAGAPFEVRLAA
jgi:AcrR family transcriptional regulator